MILWATDTQVNILQVSMEVGALDLDNVVRAGFTIEKGNGCDLTNKGGSLYQCSVLWLLLHLEV